MLLLWGSACNTEVLACAGRSCTEFWFSIDVVLSNGKLLRWLVPFEDLVRWASPDRDVILEHITAAAAARRHRFTNGLWDLSSFSGLFVFVVLLVPWPCPLALSDRRSWARDSDVIHLVNVRWFLWRSASCPGPVACLVALTAQCVPNGNNTKPEARTWVRVPCFFSPPPSRGGSVPEVALHHVPAFRNGFGDLAGTVVIVP